MSNYVELGIFLTLLDQKMHKAAELADLFEVSTKTIYRLTSKLCSAGLPVGSIAGKNGGIFLASQFKHDTWFFTEQELAYMLTVVNSNLNIEPQVANNIAAKISNHITCQKLTTAEQDSNKLFVDNMGWFCTSNTSFAKAESLLSACSNHKLITFKYANQPRMVEPYCLVYKQGDYYLYGHCITKQDFRMFRLSRMQNLQVTQTSFIPAKIDLCKRPWNNTSFNKIELTVQANADILQDISCWAKLEKMPNNYAKITAVENLGLTHKLMQYGNQLKIISPLKIASAIKSECLKIASLY